METIPHTDIVLEEELHAITTVNDNGRERYVTIEGEPLCGMGDKGKEVMVKMARVLSHNLSREFQVKSYRSNIVTAKFKEGAASQPEELHSAG